jgi:hypothetical protein
METRFPGNRFADAPNILVLMGGARECNRRMKALGQSSYF